MLTLTSPVETRAHGWPAGAKLAALALATALLFRLTAPLPLALALAAVFALALALGGRVLALALARALRPLWPFLLVLALWHLVVWQPIAGLAIALRLLAAVAAASLVTMTTPLAAMLALFRRLAAPLERLGLSSGALALSLALMIRFIPVMLARFDQIAEAWRARSARRVGWRVVGPVALSALDDAARVAEALRARGGAG
jgi:biotin transport system permease protein